MVLLEPWQDAIRVVVVLTTEEEYFLASAVLLDTDGADVVFADFVDCAGVEASNGVVAHPLIQFQRLEHILIINSFKSRCVYPWDR